MQTNATIEQAGSPVPGVIPEPVRLQADRTAPGPRRTEKPAPVHHRPWLSRARARLLSALHGDKYLVPTDPPTWEPAPDASRKRDAS